MSEITALRHNNNCHIIIILHLIYIIYKEIRQPCILTPGTATLTDISRSWQQPMCYPCSFPAAHRAWGTIPDGTSAALVAVCCLTVWPLVRQHKQLITTNTINKQRHHHWLISTWKFMHISLRGTGSTDTILPNKQRVTSRLVSGQHFALVTENVPEVTHTITIGANIFIPRCSHQRKILSAGRKVTLLELQG